MKSPEHSSHFMESPESLDSFRLIDQNKGALNDLRGDIGKMKPQEGGVGVREKSPNRLGLNDAEFNDIIGGKRIDNTPNA